MVSRKVKFKPSNYDKKKCLKWSGKVYVNIHIYIYIMYIRVGCETVRTLLQFI